MHSVLSNAMFSIKKNPYHHILIQAVCDAYLRFTYIDAHWPGAQNDSYIFKRSTLAERCEGGHMRGYWLLGDSGYV